MDLGSYRPKEHDACITAKLLNGGCLNQAFKKLGVAYAPHSMSGTNAFTAATRKRKVDVTSRVALVKKVGIVKIVRPKTRLGPRGMSMIELALVKPIVVSKNFCFSYVPNSSLGL
jgi:hypothetical protein